MSGKILHLELDGDNCISVTLSESGRISLSDITAATIGDLEAGDWNDQKPSDTDGNYYGSTPASDATTSDGTLPVTQCSAAVTAETIPTPDCKAIVSNGTLPMPNCPATINAETFPVQTSNEASYNRNLSMQSGGAVVVNGTSPALTAGNLDAWHSLSATLTTQSMSVLRPWESMTVNPSSEPLSIPSAASNWPGLKAPPTYNDHIKRRYEDSMTDKENQSSKRFKTAKDPSQSLLSQQISSFYQSARVGPLNTVTRPLNTMTRPQETMTRPLKTMTQTLDTMARPLNTVTTPLNVTTNTLNATTNRFNYPALSHLVKQEPVTSIPTLPDQRQIPASTSIYQPWVTPVKKPDWGFHHPSSPVTYQEHRLPSLGSIANHVDTSAGYRDDVSAYLPATPIGKDLKPYNQLQYESPGVDSRLNDSLGLLGSPQMDSPLTKHPYFSDLQALLSNECKREKVPQSLFSMQEKETVPKKPENVFTREQKLQERFQKLEDRHSEEVRQMSSFFRYQTALIETERFKTLHECKYPGSYKDSINVHFDDKIHQVMDRVEKSIELMEQADLEAKVSKVPKPRPHLRREAVQVMEEWYAQNVDHPYPTADTVEYLAQSGNVGVEQVKKWFANKRNRTQNTRTLTEIAMKKRKLGQLASS